MIDNEAVNVPSHRLLEITRKIVAAGGSSDREALVVADHLVQANLSGHDSHGVGMLPTYVHALEAKLLIPNQSPTVTSDQGGIMMLDGQRGYGQSVGRQAMEQAIGRCQENGVVLMTLRNSHHLGRIGTYGEQAIAAGLCSMHFVNVVDHPPFVAPYRGSDARFSTNPICLAMPGTTNQPPVLLDMATSRIAFGKARVAHNKGVDVPEGSLIDDQGHPTNDPGVMFKQPPGALRPFGEHKGYGLALFGELFGGLLSGGNTVQPGNERKGSIINNMLTVIFDPSRLIDAGAFGAELEAVVEYFKGSPPVHDDEPVLVPGDPERISRSAREEIVPVDLESWEQILTAAEKLGLDREELAP